MISLALSSCWNASSHLEGEPMLEEIREMGFTHAEIGHGLSYSKWPGVKASVEAGVIQIRSLHNFCPQPVEAMNSSPNCFQFSDDRATQRLSAVRNTILTIENAAALGAKAVVLHLGWAGPYHSTEKVLKALKANGTFDRKVTQAKVHAVAERARLSGPVMKRVRECLEQVLESTQGYDVRLGLEFRECFEEFPTTVEMAQLLKDLPPDRVGYWHDFGHAARQHHLTWHTHEETLSRFAPRLIGAHLHDFLPPREDHLPLGRGQLDFRSLLKRMPLEYLPVLELNPQVSRDEVIESLNLWNSFANI